jgi:hypothetical protein
MLLAAVIGATLRSGLYAKSRNCQIVLFRPHVNHVSEAASPVGYARGGIYIDIGMHELHVQLGQGSELIVALHQQRRMRSIEHEAILFCFVGKLGGVLRKDRLGIRSTPGL